MDPQEALQRQKKSLEIAEFERKLFEDQAKDLEEAIEARREEIKRSGNNAQKELREAATIESGQNTSVLEEEQAQEQIEVQREQIEHQDLNQQEIAKDQSISEAKSVMSAAGYIIDDSQAIELGEKPPKKSEFPLAMLALALMKDILDILLTLTGVGIILVMIYSAFYFIVSVSFTLTRMNRLGLFKKFIVKKALNRVFLSSAAELIPGLSVLPLATVFVLLNHYSETKFVKALVAAAEIMIEAKS